MVKYFAFFISFIILHRIASPITAIISFCMVFNVYTAFLGAASRCQHKTSSDFALKWTNSRKWPLLPESERVESSLWPLKGSLCFSQKILHSISAFMTMILCCIHSTHSLLSMLATPLAGSTQACLKPSILAMESWCYWYCLWPWNTADWLVHLQKGLTTSMPSFCLPASSGANRAQALQ